MTYREYSAVAEFLGESAHLNEFTAPFETPEEAEEDNVEEEEKDEKLTDE